MATSARFLAGASTRGVDDARRLLLRHKALAEWQKRLSKVMEKPNTEDADIALTHHELANATRLYHESLGDSEDSGSG